ncbi:hypothetical protein [Mangrovitalea sediminis]|uniref:hypothetical protein n=1 Tax=Mangrovitalea sediminis TaxID=1982043 RepID=UPI001178CD2B|nr:hypothetical protein [Mangrovitalea sediminis]
MRNKDCSSRERLIVAGCRYVASSGIRAGLMVLLLLFIGVPVVNAAEGPHVGSAQPDAIPPSLVPWIPWVLKGAEQTQCPRVMGLKAVFQCQWPGRLRLVMNADGMGFSQHWTLYQADWVPLPGSRELWPEQVRVDGQDASLIDRDGVPSLRLGKGEHDVEGQLSWQNQPQMIQLPALHGLIQLQGASDDTASVVQLDAKNRLWLQRSDEAQASGQAEHLQVQVFRKLDDDIPLRLATHIRLVVSGGDREVRLGRALPAGFELLSFESPLPARIDDDGVLRVQVKPGDWLLTFNARAVTDQPFLGPKPVTPNWPEAEIWSFAAHPSLRSVTLQGGKVLDPSQVPVPTAWMSLPAYQLTQGDRLTLTPMVRAKVLQQDRLHLKRTVWLDFSGEGATFNDHLMGTLHGSRRLELSDVVRPGRIDLDGKPQLITRQDGERAAGVEVRRQRLDLDAVSRLDSGPQGWEWQLPANGWLSTLDNAQVRVELPPGWRLLGVSGAGSSSGDWLGQWRIWDIFVVMLLGVVAWRVLGISWGFVALVTGMLVYPERPDAVGILLTAILASALAREVPHGRTGVFLRGLRWLALAALAAVTLVTVVHQVRLAIYPQLGGWLTARPVSAEMAGAPRAKLKAAADSTQQMFSRSAVGPAVAGAEPQPLPDWDPDAKVQTGPGIPTWAWQSASLGWRGPVDPAQVVTLYVLGPVATALMRFVMSFGLLLLLLACLLDRRRSTGGSGPRRGHRRREEAGDESWDSEPTSDGVGVAGGMARHAAGMGLLLLALMAVPGWASAQAFPDQSLLDQLRERVLAPPLCEPHCASERQTQVVLDGFDLTVTEEVSALARVAWPLPASRDAWQPDAVYVDGTRQGALRFNDAGYLELVLAPGNHEIVLEGKVAEKDALTLAFPEQPHRFSMKVRDWLPLGLVDGRPASKTLRFERQKISERRAERRTTLFQPPPPPFVRIDRTLTLGQHWTLTTRVERVAPAVGGIDLPVTLMKGEQVISPGIEVGKDDTVQVVMGPHDQVVTWQSRLTPVSRLQWAASQDSDRVDVWHLRAGPQWHVETEGVAPSQTYDASGALAPVWHPRPGEALVMTLSRPSAILGETQTVDQLELQWQPVDKGARLLLQMTVRTSLGGALQWTLPKGMQIRELSVDGHERPLSAQSNLLDVTLKPGTHRLAARVDGAPDLSTLWQTPQLALPWSVTNLNSRVQLPAGRWLLWAGGAGVGPAVLYWGILPVLIVLALVLGRHSGNPLGVGSWLLLGVGLSFASPWTALALMAWFYALGWRSRHPDLQPYWQFNLRQVALVLLTLVAFWGLFGGISQGLLGHPDMWVSGNGSRAELLRWYLDRAVTQESPQWEVVTLPLWVYRGFMLIWSLWLAVKAVGWLRWGWQILVLSGGWRHRPKKQPVES